MPSIIRRGVVGVAAALLLLTACSAGSTGGRSQVEGLSAEQVLARAKAAAAAALTLHYAEVGSGADGSSLKIRMDRRRGFVATAETGGQPLEVRKIDDVVYLRNGAKRGGQWTRTTASDPVAGNLLQLGDPAAITEAYLTLRSGEKAALGTPKDVAGHRTVALVVSGGTADRTVYVAAEGTPYPLLVEPKVPGDGARIVTFSDFNQPVDLVAPDPADVVATPTT